MHVKDAEHICENNEIEDPVIAGTIGVNWRKGAWGLQLDVCPITCPHCGSSKEFGHSKYEDLWQCQACGRFWAAE